MRDPGMRPSASSAERIDCTGSPRLAPRPTYAMTLTRRSFSRSFSRLLSRSGGRAGRALLAPPALAALRTLPGLWRQQHRLLLVGIGVLEAFPPFRDLHRYLA